MKILLVDDHASFCEGLKSAIASAREDYVVDFETDAELIPQSLMRNRHYDLYILDLMLPGLGGIKLLQYLNANRNPTPVMVLSSVVDLAVIKQAFDQGIVGFMPKAYNVHQIVEAIEQCRMGGIYVPGFLAAATPFRPRREDEDGQDSGETNSARRLRRGAGKAPMAGQITKRQMEIMSLMDKGLSNQEIANTLYISKATVKTHVNKLFRLFQVSNRINCLRAAKKAELAVPES